MDLGFRQTLSYILDAIYNSSNLSIALAVLFVFISLFHYYRTQIKDLPPGPIGVPVLGYWPFIEKETFYLQLFAMKKKYGDIFSFRVTGKLFVHLASIKMLREAYITKSAFFSERISAYNIFGFIFKGGMGFSQGEKGKTLRRYFLNQFRERGMTLYKENTAEIMNGIISSTVEELRRNENKQQDVITFLIKRSTRILQRTLFWPASQVTEREMKHIQDNFLVILSITKPVYLILAGSLAKYFVMPFIPNFKNALIALEHVKQSIQSIIDDHQRTFDGDNVRDIIDAFIKERNYRQSKGDSSAEFFTDEALISSLIQFIGDGVASIPLFISLILKALMDHPEEQDKIYNELIEVVGEDRNPGMEDKSKLTYTNAFILEAQRTTNFVPIFPSLECTRETTVGGYKIPKGAITVMNIYAIHYDPLVYENPEKFDPTRFLSKPGKPKTETPVSFGIGKHSCLGEAFVMTQTFLFCTAIVKNFHIKEINKKSVKGIFMSRNLDICFVPRK